MRTLAGRLLKSMGWKITGEFPDIPRSVVVFAPHTAHIDAFYGKLGFMELGIPYKFLSKKELFFFPMNILMRRFGSIPVRGVKGQNAIYHVAEMLKKEENLHIVISPEGWVKKVYEWNPGFYHMARKAGVPIVVAALDYGHKELSVKGVIYELEDYNRVIEQMKIFYSDVSGKKPENFILYEEKPVASKTGQ